MKPNKLREKLEHIFDDESISKKDVMDILFMAIEEGISVEEAIEDFPCESFEELYELETYYEDSDRYYDEMKDNMIMEQMEKGV